MDASNSPIQLRPIAVLRRLLTLFSAVVPGFRRRFQIEVFRFLYWAVSSALKSGDSECLNYGYASLDSDATGLKLDPEDEAERFSLQLYHRVAAARDLRGKDVLEIGCGRGGGSSFIGRYLHPAALTGVDLSGKAIRHCRRMHRIAHLRFLQGEAGNLPLPASSFDAVVNLESSHCYPSFERFLGEVARVLRPSGFLLFADLRSREDVALLRGQLKERFTIIEEEFLTAKVVHALELDSDRRNLIIQKRAPRFLHQGLQNFSAVKGSTIFDFFASGKWEYVRFVLQKPPVS